MTKIVKDKNIVVIFLLCLVILTLSSFTCIAQDNIDSKRNIIFFSRYNNIVTREGKELNLDIKLSNMGDQKEEIILSIIPDDDTKNWNYSFMENWGYFEIRSVILDSKESDNEEITKFKILVPKDIEAKDYKFILVASTKDKMIEKRIDMVIGITDTEEVVSEDVIGVLAVSTKFPAIENPAGKEFKFNIRVENNTNIPQNIELDIDLPGERWSAYCTSQWETDRITAIKLNEGVIENLVLAVIPPIIVEKGEYPITFAMRSGELTESILLKAIVTGTYKLNIKTERDLLSIDTIAGKEKIVIMQLWNEGSTAIDNITFSSTIPENWGISFNPKGMSSLPPVLETRQFENVEVLIKTPQRTLPGDYMVNLAVTGVQDQNTISIRTTVTPSTTWGWIGILIIAFIFFVLIGIFVKLKRR